jgi:hypothetical protein
MWGAVIITYSMVQVKNRVNFLLPFWLWIPAYIRLGLHPHVHYLQSKVQKHFTHVRIRADMSMKWVGGSNHNLQHDTSQKPSEFPTTATAICEPRHNQVRYESIHIAASHSRRSYASYLYDKDLIWVRNGWGASIITYSTLQVRNQDNLLLLLPLRLWTQE